MTMYIPIILGTAREGRESEKVARFMLEKALAFGLDSEIIDVRDYRLPATDNTKTSAEAIRLKEVVLKADGLVIVSPEYNHGYPGELKMMLDMLYEEYFGKPVGICGVSSGVFGGARMIEHLVATCVRFYMLPTGEVLYFPRSRSSSTRPGRSRRRPTTGGRISSSPSSPSTPKPSGAAGAAAISEMQSTDACCTIVTKNQRRSASFHSRWVERRVSIQRAYDRSSRRGINPNLSVFEGQNSKFSAIFRSFKYR